MAKRKNLESHAGRPFKRSRPPPPPRSQLLNQQISKTTTRLHKSLKLSRSIELKKLSRRSATATENNDKVAEERFEEERKTLVGLDLRHAAKRLVTKRLRKEKDIAKSLEAERAVEWSSEELPAISNEELVLVARLGGYRVVKEIMGDFTESLRSELGLESKDKGAESEKNDDESASEGEREAVAHKRRKDTVEDERMDDAPVEAEESSASDDDEDMDAENSAHTNSDSESESIALSGVDDDQDLAGDDSGWETNSDGEIVRVRPSRKASSPSYKSHPSLASTPKAKPVKEKKAKKEEKPATSSRFLPSLMAGYLSDPDSEASDDDSAPQRKNRRGQRARRAIWEKKYGDNAKHKKTEGQMDDKGRRIQNGNDRNNGRNGNFAGKKSFGGKPGGDRNGGYNKGGQGGYNKGGQSGFGKPEEKERKKDDIGKLHPSWLAAKKKKDEAQKIEFKGKKIVFD